MISAFVALERTRSAFTLARPFTPKCRAEHSSRHRSRIETSLRCGLRSCRRVASRLAHGDAPELHAGLVGSSIGFSRVARDASQRAVFPGGLSSLCSRKHVVDGQFLGAGLATAVLTGGVIAFEEVPPAERDGLMTCAVMPRQGQDFRHPQVKPHRSDEGFPITRRQLRPV